jgi:hypothetical protein
MVAGERVIGHVILFTPAVVSAIFTDSGIALLRRYGPRGPVDPRPRRMRLLTGIAAGGALVAFGLIGSIWITRTHALPDASCPARPCPERLSSDGHARTLCHAALRRGTLA